MQDPYTTYDERDIPDLETFEALHRELYAFPGWFLQQGQKSIGAWRMEMKKSLDLTRKGLEISDVDFLRFFPASQILPYVPAAFIACTDSMARNN